MAGKAVVSQELQRMHQDALLGIVNDFLSWGGAPHAEKAKLAFIEVARRIKLREQAVRRNDKILAVVS